MTVARLVASLMPTSREIIRAVAGISSGIGLASLYVYGAYSNRDAPYADSMRIGFAAGLLAKGINTAGVVQAAAAQGLSRLATGAIGGGFFAASLLHYAMINWDKLSLFCHQVLNK